MTTRDTLETAMLALARFHGAAGDDDGEVWWRERASYVACVADEIVVAVTQELAQLVVMGMEQAPVVGSA